MSLVYKLTWLSISSVKQRDSIALRIKKADTLGTLHFPKACSRARAYAHFIHQIYYNTSSNASHSGKRRAFPMSKYSEYNADN